MVFAVAALLFQLSSPPAIFTTETTTPVTNAPVVSSASAATASEVSAGEASGSTKAGTPVNETRIHLNLESVKLFSINSKENPTASLKATSSDSFQNSQSLSTVHIPEPRPVKPIPIKLAERAPSRRSWLALTLVQHGAATFDAYSTRQAVENGATEHNPLLRPFVHSPAAYGAMQICPALLDILARRMQRSDHRLFRRTWWIPQSVSTGTFLFAGVHNLNVADRQQALNRKP